MTYRVPLVALLCLATLITGCQVDTRPKTVMRFEPGDLPDVRKARKWGEYRLYAVGPKQRTPAAEAQPLASVRLATDEWVGFRRDAGGHVVGAAGDQTYVLPGGGQEYVWQMQADATQPHNSGAGMAAGVLALWILGAVAIGVAIAAAAP